MTHEQYEQLSQLMESIYDMFYNKAEHIEEAGNVSEFLKLKDWVNRKHNGVKTLLKFSNAEDKVLKEVEHDFNYLLNELDDVIKDN